RHSPPPSFPTRRSSDLALTTRMKAEGVEVIYFGGYHPEAGLLARQLADAGVEATIIGGDGLSNSEYWNIATDVAAGTVFTNASRSEEHTSELQSREKLV